MAGAKPKIVAGSDHAGYDLKRHLVQVLTEWGYEVEDVGTHSKDSTDYPDYAHEVARRVVAGDGFGLLVCGTGLGVSIAANRHAGVRAALCGDTFSAHSAREHNDANVICVGARTTGPGLAEDVLRSFLEASFEGGRHARRVAKIELAQDA